MATYAIMTGVLLLGSIATLAAVTASLVLINRARRQDGLRDIRIPWLAPWQRRRTDAAFERIVAQIEFDVDGLT